MRKTLYFCTFWHRLKVRGDFVNRRLSVQARLLAPAFVPLRRDYGLAGQLLHPFLNQDGAPRWGRVLFGLVSLLRAIERISPIMADALRLARRR